MAIGNAVAIQQSVSGLMHNVGGTKQEGWKPGRNYTEWSMKERFYVGEWLYFGYQKNMYSVLQVNHTDYENCNSDNPVFKVTGGAGRDVFQLNHSITYYFISGGGYCYHGMKLAVLVQNPPQPPAQAPLPSPKNSSPSNYGTTSVIVPISLVFITSWLFNIW
ncbi:Early nodulin-like protein [Thalictrum thalictroides]|uniref:Early nodulin-like protein n=1 Tax=Thalictrum thalictroides TaxID=46969 RepID=A0A7J6VGY5_THATH|nr:Early nodulin-like protein [Thalictrum thalictroides]